jgi:type II secretory pathway pseudopilin PulG
VTPSAIHGGFTYVGLLLAVALIGTALAGAGTVWSSAAQREREAELLFVGGEFRRAIASYYEAGAGGARQFPRSLEELVRDPRLPVVRRHLRRVYADPMTGSSEWGLVRAGDRIVGVHSTYGGRPLKTANFAPADSALAGATSYREWRFVYAPATANAESVAARVPATATAPSPVRPKNGATPGLRGEH